MEKLSVLEIAGAVSGRISCGANDIFVGDITTDSRAVSEESLFVPLAGKNADGHDYIAQAIRSGAKAVISAREIEVPEGVCVIRVADTLMALGNLARYYLEKIGPKVVAVTGSVGKTSTKEMIASVLSQKFRTLKTQGNFNNNIGLPLTIFRLSAKDEMAVLEMGMNHFGEIRELSSIAPADLAVFTNIGLSHIENLGSREGILRAKLEMLENLKPDGAAVLNKDNDMLKSAAEQITQNTLTYGIDAEGLNYKGENVTLSQEGVSFDTKIYGKPCHVTVNALGEYNVYNALCAIAVGEHFGVGCEQILRGIASYTCADMRMNVIKNEKYTLIADCYNAAPDSMYEALRVLSSMEGRKTAVLGDMLEMGDFAAEAHRNVGMKAYALGIDCLVCIGLHAKEIAKGAIQAGMNTYDVHSFDTNEECKKQLDILVKKGDAVLFKASRAMKLEELVAFLNH